MTLSWLTALILACTTPEGQTGGDCSDGADNDDDGLFDCLDDGCFGSPDCLGAGEGDADADTDTDTDTDTHGSHGDDFDFVTTQTLDSCGDLLAIGPTVMAQPVWAQPVFLPSLTDMPQDQLVAFPPPLGDQTATLDGHPDHAFVIVGAVTALVLDTDPRDTGATTCTVDVTLSGGMDFTSFDQFDGSLDLSFAGFSNACPAPTSDPCDMALTLRATRAP